MLEIKESENKKLDIPCSEPDKNTNVDLKQALCHL